MVADFDAGGSVMTRRKLAMLFAAALVILYSYDVVATVVSGTEMKWLTLFGLGLALALLVIEIQTVEKRKANGS